MISFPSNFSNFEENMISKKKYNIRKAFYIALKIFASTFPWSTLCTVRRNNYFVFVCARNTVINVRKYRQV